VITLPNLNTTDVLNDNQLRFLALNLPFPKANTGRPSYPNIELLPGILKVLRSGCRWRDLDRKDCPTGITHWRRLRFWNSQFGLKDTWNLILKKLNELNRIDLNIASIDGSLVPSFNFFDTTGYSENIGKQGQRYQL